MGNNKDIQEEIDEIKWQIKDLYRELANIVNRLNGG